MKKLYLLPLLLILFQPRSSGQSHAFNGLYKFVKNSGRFSPARVLSLADIDFLEVSTFYNADSSVAKTYLEFILNDRGIKAMEKDGDADTLAFYFKGKFIFGGNLKKRSDNRHFTAMPYQMNRQETEQLTVEIRKAINQERPKDYLRTGWYLLDDKGIQRRNLAETRDYILNPAPFLTAANFESISIQRNYVGDKVIAIQLDSIGKQILSAVSEKMTGKQVGFVFNDLLISTPFINAKIDMGYLEVSSPYLKGFDLNKGNYIQYVAEVMQTERK